MAKQNEKGAGGGEEMESLLNMYYFFFLHEWLMQHLHCSGHLHYDLKIMEDSHRLQANRVPFLNAGLGHPWIMVPLDVEDCRRYT